jgi:hypothetical protein
MLDRRENLFQPRPENGGPETQPSAGTAGPRLFDADSAVPGGADVRAPEGTRARRVTQPNRSSRGPHRGPGRTRDASGVPKRPGGAQARKQLKRAAAVCTFALCTSALVSVAMNAGGDGEHPGRSPERQTAGSSVPDGTSPLASLARPGAAPRRKPKPRPRRAKRPRRPDPPPSRTQLDRPRIAAGLTPEPAPPAEPAPAAPASVPEPAPQAPASPPEPPAPRLPAPPANPAVGEFLGGP